MDKINGLIIENNIVKGYNGKEEVVVIPDGITCTTNRTKGCEC